MKNMHTIRLVASLAKTYCTALPPPLCLLFPRRWKYEHQNEHFILPMLSGDDVIRCCCRCTCRSV